MFRDFFYLEFLPFTKEYTLKIQNFDLRSQNVIGFDLHKGYMF